MAKRVKKFVPDILVGHELELSEWILAIEESDTNNLLPPNCFPSDQLREEYLQSVGLRSDVEVKSLLRRFLIRYTRYGIDSDRMRSYAANIKTLTIEQIKNPKYEYERDLLTEPWQRNTWILNLLPDYPSAALNALSAYILANWQFMTDFMINGHDDAMAIIRKKYIESQTPQEVFLELGPYRFEYLTAALLRKMGYEVSMTKKSHDGGIDVIAKRDIAGNRETVYAQCKCVTKNIGVSCVRDLLGAVADGKASKGILFSTAGFSSESRKFSRGNPRIDLVDINSLCLLLNEHLGPTWPAYVDSHCRPI
jgi:restriction system protein